MTTRPWCLSKNNTFRLGIFLQVVGEKHCLYVNHESGSDGIILTLPVIFPSEKSVLNLCGAERDKISISRACLDQCDETWFQWKMMWNEVSKNHTAPFMNCCLISQHVNSLAIEKMRSLTSASVSSSVRCSVENFSVSDFFPLPLRKVRLNSVPWPFPAGAMPQISPYGHWTCQRDHTIFIKYINV